MDDPHFHESEEAWEAGFEGGRVVVTSKLGPFTRVFARPSGFVKRFYHRAHDLCVRDWQVHPTPLRLGPFCEIQGAVSIRYQATVQYAREHLERLADLDGQIQDSLETLLKDVAEQEIRVMEEDFGWLREGWSEVEKAVERRVNETMALRDIQCRARCRIEVHFSAFDDADPGVQFSAARYAEVYREAQRRRHEARERLLNEMNEQAAAEYRNRLEREERLLAMAEREDELRKARLDQELQRLRAELAAEEARASRQRETEARQREEQIQHDSRLRKMETEAELKEKDRRAQNLDDMERHLQREIELLAMERQRL